MAYCRMKVKIWELKEETEFDLELPENTTVEVLKRQVATRCGCQQEQVILLVQGRALVDSTASLRAEGVLDYDRLHLIIRQAEDPPQGIKSPFAAAPGSNFPKSAPQPAAARSPIPYTPSFTSKTVIPSSFSAPEAAKPGLEPSGGSSANRWKLGQSTSDRPPIPKTELKSAPRATIGVAQGSAEGIRPTSTGLKAAPMPSPGFANPELVARLIELGHTAAEAERALQMAKGDVEMAGAILSGDSASGGAEDVIEQLRTMARNDPDKFDEMMRTQPQMAALNAQFPGGLKEALLSGAPLGGMGSGTAADAPLTPTDESNIQHLTELGFTVEKAKAAYLACGRDSDVAAEALFNGS